MEETGLCCGSLKEPPVLMKMGLVKILLGHVNFLLAALVHGVVLRHINLHKQARAMEYAISNVVALTAGLVGVIVGILTIILSKNKKSRCLTLSVFIVGLISALMAAASAIGLLVSVVRAIIHGGRSLLTHCRFPDAIGYSSVTNECPFDPTRIYSTTLVLWVPLIVTCVVQLVLSARCCSVCASFLGLPCRPHVKRKPRESRGINVVRPLEDVSPSTSNRTSSAPPTRYSRAPSQHSEAPSYSTPPQYSAPHRLVREYSNNQRRTPHSKHSSLPPPERRPIYPAAQDPTHMSPPEQQQLLSRGTVDRSSFWI
ncbi:transmembrane protein 54-like [Synchiropus picturatus]